MRIVIQRVSEARVEVGGKTVGRIGKGLLVYLSVGKGDAKSNAEFIAEKLSNLRVFSDENDKMNLSVQDVGGSILLVSNFTLHGDCRKGRRPGFDAAAEPTFANELYEYTAGRVRQMGIKVETGTFGASMKVQSINDGPITFVIDY
jgi:D-tyrosyl-tRNA(Tyr) deacylase